MKYFESSSFDKLKAQVRVSQQADMTPNKIENKIAINVAMTIFLFLNKIADTTASNGQKTKYNIVQEAIPYKNISTKQNTITAGNIYACPNVEAKTIIKSVIGSTLGINEKASLLTVKSALITAIKTIHFVDVFKFE